MDGDHIKLKNTQQGLQLKIVDFNLDDYWNSHLLIENLRAEILPFLKQKTIEADIPFDPQDLEHQTLFFLSTFNAGSITKKIIQEVVEQQYRIIEQRLTSKAKSEELQYLFRGLKKFYPDLNIHYRLKLKRKNNELIAVGDGRKFEVEFKKITDPQQISLFTDAFHYIHQSRTHGDTFAFYFKGDRYPWAIETTERSIYSRPYKRAALLAHGFHPDKGIELTRFYTLPGAPLNAISAMDGLVKQYYKNTEIQVIFTKTMPAYSKSKATTISGGLCRVLCANELEHVFVRKNIGELECWEHVSRRWIENNHATDLKFSNASFGLLPAVDVYIDINQRAIPSLKELEQSNKAIYFNKQDMRSYDDFVI